MHSEKIEPALHDTQAIFLKLPWRVEGPSQGPGTRIYNAEGHVVANASAVEIAEAIVEAVNNY